MWFPRCFEVFLMRSDTPTSELLYFQVVQTIHTYSTTSLFKRDEKAFLYFLLFSDPMKLQHPGKCSYNYKLCNINGVFSVCCVRILYGVHIHLYAGNSYRLSHSIKKLQFCHTISAAFSRLKKCFSKTIFLIIPKFLSVLFF